MSDVQETTSAAPVAETTPVAEPAPQQAETTTVPETSKTEQMTAVPAITTTEPSEVAEEKPADEVAAPEQKPVEAITEGQLQYKAPGLINKIIPSKKEFWVTEEAVPDLNLSLYLRGEKAEVANPVAAWATQTGKGLLFFTKKGESNRKQPPSVLPMYEATELKKQGLHEITFHVHNTDHTLKAASEAERDGWYMTLEKSVELGKASRDSVQGSEGYKAELDRLSKPLAPSAVAHAKVSQAQPKTDGEPAEEAAVVAEEDKKQKQKSRSTSRGVLNRIKGKKEESEQKEEKKAEESKEDDAAAEAAGADVVAGGLVAAAEEKKGTTEESAPAVETKAEEKPKVKRNSIFGSLLGKKEQKEVQPTTEEPATENAPHIPEPSPTGATETVVITDAVKPAAETKPEGERVTPGKEKKNFLSGLSFAKRGRSVSPSQNVKETPAKTETAEEAAEASKTDDSAAAVVVPAVAPASVPAETESAEKPEEKTEETPKAETPTTNKRQSVFGNIGRRASNYMKGFQGTKKENAAPKPAEETKEEAEETKAATEEPAAAEAESKPVEEQIAEQQQIGDVVPEAVNVGQPQQSTPVITASA